MHSNFPTGSKILRLCFLNTIKNCLVLHFFSVQGSASPLVHTNVTPRNQWSHCQFTPTEILSEACISAFGVSACRSWESCRGVARLVADTSWARYTPGLQQREAHSGPSHEQSSGCDTDLKGRGMWNWGKWDNPWKCGRIQKSQKHTYLPFW